MNRKISLLLAVCLLIICLTQNNAVFSKETGSSDFILEICMNLDELYWNPAQINYPKILNIALQSAADISKEKGVYFAFCPIAGTVSRAEAKRQFANEFNRMDRLIIGKNIKREDIIFPVAYTILESFKDSHTYFLSPQTYKIVKDMANAVSFGGIGVEIYSKNKDFYYINRVIANMPASRAGLKKFDIIMAVNGKRKFASISELGDCLRGPVGSNVKIIIQRKIHREIKELNFQLKRDSIKPTFFDKKLITSPRNRHRLFYLDLRTFHINGECNLTDHLFDQKTNGVIIDLRNNSGGYLYICDDLMDQFISANKVLYYARDTKFVKKYITSACSKINLPVVVLINENSASASEIFSGVMQEQGRAKIIGKKSMGCVSFGSIQGLPYDAAMMVTVKEFFTAKGKTLEKVGVTPNIEIDLTKEDIKNGVDAQLKKAIEVLEGQLKH